MKKECRKLLHACGLILLLASVCLAQQPLASVSEVREQIRKLEAAGADPAMTPEVRALAGDSLNRRRAQLAALLERKIDALVKYQSAAKEALTEAENRAVADSLRALEDELRELRGKMTAGEPVAALAPAASAPALEGSSAPARLAPAVVAPPEASPESNVAAAAPPAPQTVTPVSPTTCSGASDAYPDAPPLLRDAAERAASDIVSGDLSADEAVSFTYRDMFFYTVAHAVAPAEGSEVASIRSIKAYQYLGETVRTDKQVGAPPKSAGTTSAVEKPGFARLLGLAVENGAIIQEVSKTSLTLSTSPYMLYTFGGGDTAENYERAGFLNRIGLFATFNLTDQNNPLSSATRSQLTQWSVKARVFGDRSTRSKAFQRFWFAENGPHAAIQSRLNAATSAFQLTLTDGTVVPDFRRFANVRRDVHAVVGALTGGTAYRAANDAEKRRLLTNAILCVFRNEVFNNIRDDPTVISPETRQQINAVHVPAIAAAMNNIDAVRKLVEEKLEEFQKGALGTVSYVNHRQSQGSDYSEGKFLFEMDSKAMRPLNKVVANFGLTFYHNPDSAKNQQTTRDVTAALSFEGGLKSPMLAGTPDLSKITYAFTGSYQRTFENRGVAGRKADIGSFQFKLDFPIFAGVSLPFAVTYSNATEEERKKRVRANFGLNFDADKLFAVTRLMR